MKTRLEPSRQTRDVPDGDYHTRLGGGGSLTSLTGPGRHRALAYDELGALATSAAKAFVDPEHQAPQAPW